MKDLPVYPLHNVIYCVFVIIIYYLHIVHFNYSFNKVHEIVFV